MPKWVPQLHDPAWLYVNYVKKGKTARQISDEIVCVPSAVTQALHRYEITTRLPGRERIQKLADREWLAETYKQHTSLEIAREIGCNPTTVIDALRRHGLPVREMSEKRRPCRTPYLQKKGPEGLSKYIHRQVVEIHLGRKLSSDEHVHHKDGNTLNNAIGNLEVLSKYDHHLVHIIQRWLSKTPLDQHRRLKDLVAYAKKSYKAQSGRKE